MIGGATALEVDSIQFNPSPIDYNDTVDVTANVDSEDNYIKTVDLKVLKGGDTIHDKEMSLYRGSRTGFAQFRDFQTFTVDENKSYMVRATAYSEEGEISTFKREILVENGSVRLKTTESDNSATYSIGNVNIDLGTLATFILAGTLIYAAVTWDE